MDLACPRCKSTRYRNPNLKLMVNVCGHTLCESCVDLLFLKGTGACPECNVPLRRNNFRVQLFEDPEVEKEVDIRRRILRDYNKREEDFETLEEYNNYLEEIEAIIHNLCNNIDIIGTNKRIEQYKRENREVIQRNRNRLGREELELEELLEMERLAEEARRQELLELETEMKKRKTDTKEALLDELQSSGKDATDILNEFAERIGKQVEEEKKLPPPKPVTEFSTGIKLGRGGEHTFLAVPNKDYGPLYTYEEQLMFVDGPPTPTVAEIKQGGYLENIRAENAMESAGGYTASMACQRALQDRAAGLYFNCRK